MGNDVTRTLYVINKYGQVRKHTFVNDSCPTLHSTSDNSAFVDEFGNKWLIEDQDKTWSFDLEKILLDRYEIVRQDHMQYNLLTYVWTSNLALKDKSRLTQAVISGLFVKDSEGKITTITGNSIYLNENFDIVYVWGDTSYSLKSYGKTWVVNEEDWKDKK